MKRAIVVPLVLGLVVMTAAGCMSREDRIKEVIEYELEACKQAEGDFYTVETHDGGTHRILAELCHLEATDVVMNNEWTGTLRTGPLEWTGGEDQASRAMVLTRVAWGDFDRAMRYRHQSNAGIEELRAAEVSLAAAQDTYGESSWLRVERLRNLLELRALDREADNPASIGAEAKGYFEELVQWAQENNRPVAAAQARLVVSDHLLAYRDRQQRGVENLGSGDRRLVAAIEHAEEAGNAEEAAEYREELEERQARRPEAQAEMEERIAFAEQELCELRDGLSVSGITDDDLRGQITAALRRVDCDEVRAAAAAGKEDEGEGDE